MTYSIRPYRDGDAETLPDLWRSAVSQIGSRRYSPSQIEAWLSRQADPATFRTRVAKGAIILVAAGGDDAPLAYTLLEPDGHLDHLFCHPDHTRRGLAERLLAEAEDLARNSGIERLYTEASALACPAFERAGYCVTHRRDFEIDGVPIYNWAMQKALG